MSSRKKLFLLTCDDYCSFIVSIKEQYEEMYTTIIECNHKNTTIHTCLTYDYCNVLMEKLVLLIYQDEKKPKIRHVELNKLLCTNNQNNISYYKCLDSNDVFELLKTPKTTWGVSEFDSPLYNVFVKYCAILENAFFLDFDAKKEAIEYLFYFFTFDGKLGRKEKKAIKAIKKKILEIDICLQPKEILKEIQVIFTISTEYKANAKEKRAYFDFLDYMKQVIDNYLKDKDDNEISEIVSIMKNEL